jgi:hypothetical protein
MQRRNARVPGSSYDSFGIDVEMDAFTDPKKVDDIIKKRGGRLTGVIRADEHGNVLEHFKEGDLHKLLPSSRGGAPESPITPGDSPTSAAPVTNEVDSPTKVIEYRLITQENSASELAAFETRKTWSIIYLDICQILVILAIVVAFGVGVVVISNKDWNGKINKIGLAFLTNLYNQAIKSQFVGCEAAKIFSGICNKFSVQLENLLGSPLDCTMVPSDFGFDESITCDEIPFYFEGTVNGSQLASILYDNSNFYDQLSELKKLNVNDD